MMRQAESLLKDDPDAAHRLCMEVLRHKPDSLAANTMAGVINHKADRPGAALAYFERVTQLAPHKPEGWNNLGTVYHELRLPIRAREHFMRAWELRKDDWYAANVGATYVETGDYKTALSWVKKALAINPECTNALTNAAFVHLGAGNWSEGWRCWRASKGTKHRKWLDFGAPEWDGKRTGKLVLYGEQGIGDEVMFGSCVHDALELADEVHLECDPRLEGLFRRSFPGAVVHGTRRMDRPWADAVRFDAQASTADLPEFFRPTRESCPRVAYLTPDPERVIMWRALFRSWGKPVVGLCWSGGKWSSQQRKRDVGLEAFRPLIERRDAVYVSLQYKDPSAEIEACGLPVRVFGAAMSDDFDDTAALVAALDDMVGIHTTVHHLRGAMGMASTILVPHLPLWNYATGDALPWYRSQVFHRQRESEAWVDCIRRLV